MNRFSDGISRGAHHPERPLPTAEVVFAADEYANEHLQWAHAPVQEGVGDVLDLAGMRPEFVGDRTNLDAVMTSMLVNAWDEGREQVDTSKVFERFSLNVGTRAVVLTWADLYTRNTNFVFGVTAGTSEAGFALLSAYRFQELPQGARELALKHIAKHEFGHLIGLDETGIRNQDTRNGIYTGHCINSCVMQQANSLREAVKQADELDGMPNHGFCYDCAETAASMLSQ